MVFCNFQKIIQKILLINSIKYIFSNPVSSFLIITNLILIEGILSIDNAIILSHMIINLKREDRKKAINYGTIGAYILRLICLFFSSYLIKIKYLKLFGGVYLIFIGINFFKKKIQNRKNNIIKLKTFWKTVFTMEIIDLLFSIDNIFASISLTNNFVLISIGILIGIICIRISTKLFVNIIQKFKILYNTVFIFIILLGIKMVISNFYYFNNISFFIGKIFPFITIFIFISIIIIEKLKKFFLN